jgi:hypothetical protein
MTDFYIPRFDGIEASEAYFAADEIEKSFVQKNAKKLPEGEREARELNKEEGTTGTRYEWTYVPENDSFYRTAPPAETVEEKIDLLKRRLLAVAAGSKCALLKAKYEAELASLA